MPPLPPPRGGRALPPKPKPMKPPAPRVIRPKAPDPNAVASQNAMSAFRTAVAQLQSSTPAVDSAAIYAPYRASQQVTGQLGQGLQQAVLGSGQQAQQQYGQALGQAQQQAAQFGISAGAGANPTALQNTGTAPLAQQTNAYAAAAPQAAAQWQQLLERSAAAKVAGATTDRNNLIAQGTANLSTALPGAIRDEKQSLFQAKTQRENMGLARSQLTAKQRADLQDYILGATKIKNTTTQTAVKNNQTQQQINEKIAHDRAVERAAARKLSQGDQALAIKRRASQANAKGLKGVSAAVKALSGTTSGGSTKKAAKGWDVTVAIIDPDTGEPTGDTKVLRLPDKRKIPKGFKFVSAETHYATVPNTPSTKGVTPKQWDQQMRSLLAQNPGQSASIKAFLGPRPRK